MAYESVGSTNDVAAALAGTADGVGTVVLAAAQTAGRGQYGRAWHSRPGGSLLMSALLAPPPAVRRPVVLTAWAAVAVAEAVSDLTGVEAGVKWPNDLLVDGKKVCGILIEQATGAAHRTVVGIGLNLNQSAAEFVAAGLPAAASLAVVGGLPVEMWAAAEAVVRRLDGWYDRMLNGDLGGLEADWRRRVGLVGRRVAAELFDGTVVAGRLRDLSFDAVEVTSGAGSRAVRPELVRHLREE